MAHAKAKGSTKLGRDSISKRLGVKIFGGQKVQPGDIIVRQKGTKFKPAENVGMGGDYTIFAKIPGQVIFKKKVSPHFSGKQKTRVYVSVRPQE